MKLPFIRGLVLLSLFSASGPLVAQAPLFNYSKYLAGTPRTLSVWVTSADSNTGLAQVNGGDSQAPGTPFTWQWGDGSSHTGWFPQSHAYANTSRNYVLTVIANYSNDTKDTCRALIGFVPITYGLAAPNPDVAVSVPSTMPPLSSRHYGVPGGLVPFADTFFQSVSRSTLESVLSLTASIELDLANDDVYRLGGAFQQIMLHSPGFGGAYSLWFTDPVSFGVGEVFLQGTIGYSSLLHEMGHNFSLNSPAAYYYGSRIDGNANAIFSESMAQIYQHAAGWMLLNSKTYYDMPDDLYLELLNSVSGSIKLVRSSYEDYVATGRVYRSWNDPITTTDETFGTFMTVAYKYFQHAESSGMGYRAPLKRMMHLLKAWDSTLQARYDPQHDAPAADTFRATLMVCALSYAFKQDFRTEFRDLNFPIDDNTYYQLLTAAQETNTVPVLVRLISDVTLTPCAETSVVDLEEMQIFRDPDEDGLTYIAVSSAEQVAHVAMSGDTLRVYRIADGLTKISVKALDGRGGEERTAFAVRVVTACDEDGIPEDGDGSGTIGDNPCLSGQTTGCDDNCPSVTNPSQTDSDLDGVGDACCCSSKTGNVNYASIVDLSDLSALVSYLTGGVYVLPCPNEANVNAIGIVDLGDLSALVSYLTGGGYMLPNCM